ncbi:MAG: hypothetical protein RR192_01085 [Peptostreptococcaceae bacterium]
MNNNHDINANILGYNPDLTINTRPYSNIEDDISTPYLDYYNSNKSVVVEEFELHTPSSKVNNLINLKKNIKDFKKQIKSDIVGVKIADKFFSSEYEDESKEIEDINKNDLENGSTKLEAYIELDNLYKEVSSVLDSFIILIYGKDVDHIGASEIDEAYIERINILESIEEYEKVNYFSLYYDTQISFLIGEYSNKMFEISADLSIIEDKMSTIEMNESNNRMLMNSFTSINSIFNKDKVKDEYSCNDIIAAMHNVFLSKQDINMYLDTFSSLFSLGEEYQVVEEIRQSNMEDLEEKLDNLVKAIMYSPISKSDIADSLCKKSRIRGFFTN